MQSTAPAFQRIDLWANAVVRITAQFGIPSTVEQWRMAHSEGRYSIVVTALDTPDGRIDLQRPIRVHAPAPDLNGGSLIRSGGVRVHREGFLFHLLARRVSSAEDVLRIATR